eukprot:CAMPEP_0116027404 /NCGR_PEP_ID=MMETSP0321-20121206/14621_1 /TAXON_ID=163516 /ORGANISM="Leptocylindrus danicus var. danicus, Strain B650" /LENGTH=365 /DNA_ID=CAMNT_0003500777 /DNA_START=156 /DNA_END=1253 /DNA_ORIENTATION=+
MNLIGSICINGGTNLMKLGHTKEVHLSITGDDSSSGCKRGEQLTSAKQKKGKIWYCGSIFFVIGNILNFISFSFAPQSLLAALGSAQFVSNVFFGKIILGEIVTKKTIIATITIILGNALVVYSFSRGDDNSTTTDLTANDILANFDQTYAYFVLGLAVLFLLCWHAYHTINDRVERGELVMHAHLILPTTFAAYSAILGSHSVLFAKCLSILLRSTYTGNEGEEDGGQIFEHTWFTQAIFVGWLVTITFWLRQMNSALIKFDGLFVIPVLQVMWTFSSIISGGVFFKEFQALETSQTTGFAIGMCIVFSGVYLLSPSVVTETIERRSTFDAELLELTPKLVRSVSREVTRSRSKSAGDISMRDL